MEPLARLDPVDAWKPWVPEATNPWSLKWAGHLYRRAAFGATWQELQTAVRTGPAETLNNLFTPGPGQADFDKLMDSFAPSGQFQPVDAQISPLQGWWLYRMVASFFPLQERMTLFWHNHFATSLAKVQQLGLMANQNILIRKHTLGKFRVFVKDISSDPAMLVWLDSNSNVKGKANENYARELMELFTLGVGNYTEQDVHEAARAFTGWHTNGQDFTFNRFQHDDGPKIVLGQTGNWDGTDVIRILLDQPAAARFLVRKLYRHFISETETPPDSLLDPLAERFRESDCDIADLMRTMLRSRLFFSEYAYRQRVKSPAEYIVSLLRSLEAKGDQVGPAITALAQTMDGLGQTLFAPPTVKGWDGGKAWLNSATLLARHNAAWRLVQGIQGPVPMKVNPALQVQKYAGKDDPARQVGFLLDLLLQPGPDDVADKARQRLADFLAHDKPKGAALERRLRETTHAVLLMPEYQLA
jgi:uncharacterized protein (DUF1800 family)